MLLASLAMNLAAPYVSGRTEESPVVVVTVDKKINGDGWYNFEISESGVGPTGRYQRKFSFAAEIKRGVAVPSNFKNYASVMTTQRAGVWKTHREPIAGYLYVFFEGGRAYADFRLIESWDGHPTRMTINGVYSLVAR
jgi:hypothetical protein